MARRKRSQPDQPHLPGLEPGIAESDSPADKTASWSPPPARPALAAAAAVAPPCPAPPAAATGVAAASAADGTADLAGRTVIVIDANSLIYQVFHAIPEMTGPQGQPVNAIFGFTRDLISLIENKRPDYLLAAFDLPGPTFRHELYDQYKAQRAETPDALIAQLPGLRQVLAVLEIPVLEVPGYEADDILATLARQVSQAGGECLLVSGDKDCRQLLGPRVKIYNIRKNVMFNEQSLLEEWGIRPEQVVDFQALVGDAVDNVPGVPGIGPKTARDLLVEYGSLEGVLAHIDALPGEKRRAALREFGAQARVSRQLTRLESEMALAVDWPQARVDGFDGERAAQTLASFGFRSLTEKVRGMGRPATAAGAADDWQADYQTVTSMAQLRELVAELQHAPWLSVDTETTGLSPLQADLVGVSLCAEPGRAWYIPVRAPLGEPQLETTAAIEALRPLLEQPQPPKVGQNLKYDLLVLWRHGLRLAGVAADTMVADYLLESGERNHNLDELARRYLRHENIPISDLIGSGAQQRTMDQVAVPLITQYAAEDADVALRLWPLLRVRLEALELQTLFDDVEMPLLGVLAELEYQGIRVDSGRLRELSEQFAGRLVELEREIFELAGGPFNIASPKQLQQVLFEQQKLPVVKKTKTGPSTDADVLEELAAWHPLPAKILEYRQYAKLKNTYVDALPTMINPRTGRIHASFNQVVAATGRLSSSDPNLQNIPIRTESGRDIRSAFLPGEEGWELLAADYSQIELRVLAHFSQDAALCEAFARDEDIHALVASQVFGVPQAEVTSAQRRVAKAVNFGVIYGQSPFGLAKQLGIEQAAAAKFIDDYFARYPGVDEFLSTVLADCLRDGYVKTILGRRRAIQGVRADAGRLRNLPERTAINTVIQGSAADLIKQAMLAVHSALRAEGLAARMLLQIHDELVFEAPLTERDRLAALARREMAQVMQLRVPLKVDVKTGRNWAEVEPLG